MSLFLAYRNKYLVYLDTLSRIVDVPQRAESSVQSSTRQKFMIFYFFSFLFLLLVVSILECSASASTSMSTSMSMSMSTRTQTGIHVDIVQLLEPLELDESCELVAIL